MIDDINNNKKKLNSLSENLNKLAVQGKSKYSISLGQKNPFKQQTVEGDKGYQLEKDHINLQQILNIGIYVVENQIRIFRETFYSRYKDEIVKIKNSLTNKNLKAMDVWENMIKLLN